MKNILYGTLLFAAWFSLYCMYINTTDRIGELEDSLMTRCLVGDSD